MGEKILKQKGRIFFKMIRRKIKIELEFLDVSILENVYLV
jgi:hypothetical protein